MLTTFRDLQVKALMVFESLPYIAEEEVTITDQFSKLVDECLRKLFTCEFVDRERIHLPSDVIERPKSIFSEEICNLLIYNFVINKRCFTQRPFDMDSFIYHGTGGYSVINLSFEYTRRRNLRYDESLPAWYPARQLRENTSILFAALQKAPDENLSILNELSVSLNKCLNKLFTLQFVERTQPQVELEELMNLEKIVEIKAFAELKKLSVTIVDYTDYVPPIISYNNYHICKLNEDIMKVNSFFL
jgi:hypothetical protein